jgi:hypothetical protein
MKEIKPISSVCLVWNISSSWGLQLHSLMSSARYPVFAACRFFSLNRSDFKCTRVIYYCTVFLRSLFYTTPHATGFDMAEGSDNLQLRVATSAITDKSSKASPLPGELQLFGQDLNLARSRDVRCPHWIWTPITGSATYHQKREDKQWPRTMLTKLSGSATSEVATGSTNSLQDAQRNTRRPPAIGGSSRDSTSNTLHEAKAESSAIDPLSQVRAFQPQPQPHPSITGLVDICMVMCWLHSNCIGMRIRNRRADEDRALFCSTLFNAPIPKSQFP